MHTLLINSFHHGCDETKKNDVAMFLSSAHKKNAPGLLQAETVEEIEGLWAPFKAKRQTRSSAGMAMIELLLSYTRCVAKDWFEPPQASSNAYHRVY